MNGTLPDLHRHLDGSLRLSTLRELASGLGLGPLPEDLYFYPGMGLRAALDRFALTLSVLQDEAALARVAGEICEDAASDGVSTLEIRFAPHLHGGTSPERAVDAVLDGVGGRAGVILCGLYGDPPGLLESLVDMASTRRGVVAIDLAGGPSSEDFDLAAYAAPFSRARSLGIGRTVHAGEGRSVEEIEVAIRALFAQRIGHGTTLLHDPRVVELVLERGVTIEACPTSNHQVGAIESVEAHPIGLWLELGVSVCVNTDNTLFSQVVASEEHRRALEAATMDEVKLARAIACGHAAAFERA